MFKNKGIFLFLMIILSLFIFFIACAIESSGGSSDGGSASGAPSGGGLSSSAVAFSFIETFNSVPDGTNINADKTTLDNPAVFTAGQMSGAINAGTGVSGSGAISMGTQRMSFVVNGLSGLSNPVLKVTIKNDNGSGDAVASLNLAVGDSYSTGGAVGATGYRAHGSYSITNTAYQVLEITLNTSFTNTNTIQFRGIVGSSGTAGLHIDKIEISGTSGGSASSASDSSASVSSESSTSTSSVSSASSVSFSVPSTGDPIGYANGGSGTTGGKYGGNTNSVVVTTGAELIAAISGRATRTTPLIIYVNGKITTANTGDDHIEIKGSSDSNRCENLSIIGIGAAAEFENVGILLWRVRNIIIQNITVHHVVTWSDKDCISVKGPASNVWIDHCELYNSVGDLNGNGTIGDSGDKDYYDSLLDTKYPDLEYVTYSFNYLHDSYKTGLTGYTDSDANLDWKVTWYANRIENCSSRLPMIRGGGLHILNNYYEGILSSGINCRLGGTSMIEGNYFKDSKDPIGQFYDSDTGYWDLGPGTTDSNYYDNCTWSPLSTGSSGTFGSAYHSGFLDTGTYTPAYSYTPMPAADVPDYVIANAGVGKL